MSEKTASIRELLNKEVAWHWSEKHEKSFQELKEILCQAPVLKYYNPNEPLTIQVDASSKGIGCALVQGGKPVAYASRALTHAQQQYAQIEKELLAIVVGCTKFEEYIIGRSAETIVETDHKPLESIMKKPLYKAPARLQMVLIQLQRYPEVNVKYFKGADMTFADPLSRAYIPASFDAEIGVLEEELEVDAISTLPISSRICEKLMRATENELHTLQDQIMVGWPENRDEVPVECRPYWNYREQLTCTNGLIFNGPKVVIPGSWKKEMLRHLHKSHLGIVKTKQRARDIMCWPGMNADIEEMITRCAVCVENQPKNTPEPLTSHYIPECPWAKVGSDLLAYRGKNYVVAIDYHSKFIVMREIQSLRSSEVIKELKSIFSEEGLPDELVTDNGPCYRSSEFAEFTSSWDIEHTTSSPMYARSNGQAESAVKIVKGLLKKADDQYLALLEYNTTPLADVGLSPSQMLNSRRLRSTVPTPTNLLMPEVQPSAMKSLHKKQQTQKLYHDRTARSKPFPDLSVDQPVRMYRDGKWLPATVTEKLPNKSFVVATPEGAKYRRTRSHLHKTKEPAFKPKPAVEVEDLLPPTPEVPPTSCAKSPVKSPAGGVITRSGRHSKPPRRLISD